ncbi:MAG: response regulator [Nitrospira sp.]|nr:response regulator [Nitrospira sp.]
MPKIVVADDSIAVRKVAERLLIEAGFEVILAANGEEVLAALERELPDLIVCDVIMPDKSGYEICAIVRNHSHWALIPVLLMSGIVNDEVMKQAQSCQADGVLKKPFQGTSLKDKILELLQHKQHRMAMLPPPAECNEGSLSVAAESFEKDRSSHAGEVSVVVIPSQTDDQRSLSDGHQEESRDVPDNSGVERRLKEIEALLGAEQAKAENLAKRVAELEQEVLVARETERVLEEERQRVRDLQSKVDGLQRELSRIPELESLLREAHESATTARQEEAAAMKRASETIAQLEATLQTEQAAAALLVQQMTELEQEAARGKHAEAMLATAQQQVADLEQRITETEAALSATKTRLAEVEAELEAERRKTEDYERRLSDLEARAAKIQGLKVLLSAERERSAEIAQKLAETEWIAMNATKRLEEIGAKLRDIASMTLELSKGIGERESAA